MTRVIGLTGGIAAGKSLVAKIFETQENIPVLDADQMVRKLSAPGGTAEPLIRARFGTSDRTKLRALIFQDPEARKDLEGILHPLLKGALQEELKRLGNPPLVLYEAALLVETGRYRELQGLIVVTAPDALRIERLMKRDAISQIDAQKILDAQTSDENRLKAADFHLKNHGDESDLREQIRQIAQKLRPSQ
jgi:dephospho-CoA kinase